MVICEARALKKEVQKACCFQRYVIMLGFGHTESTCLEKEVRKAYTFVLSPSQECFCGTDAEFRYSEILDLIKPDRNRVVPARDGTIYLVDIKGTRYRDSI